MDSYLVILLSILLFVLASRGVQAAFRTKPLRPHADYRVVAVGTLGFMYVSWLVVYMANVKPFIHPVYKHHEG